MRVTAAFNKILGLLGVWVSKVAFEPGPGRGHGAIAQTAVSVPALCVFHCGSTGYPQGELVVAGVGPGHVEGHRLRRVATVALSRAWGGGRGGALL